MIITTTYRSTILIGIVSALSGCSRFDDSTDSSHVPEMAVRQEAPRDIVFRGRYFRSKECRELGGALALGMWGVCEIEEVVEGDLKLKYLKDVDVPADVMEGRIYTFRWKPSDSTRESLRKAEEGGFTGIWLHGDTLELIRDGQPDR